MPAIHLSAVRKNYGFGQPAVDDIDLDIPDGSFTCLLGPSGCGKTTTLRMIAGLESLTSGTIAVGDSILDSTEHGVFVPPEKRGMGLVFQNYALWPHLTVRQNVEFGLRLRRLPAAKRNAGTDRALRMMQIHQVADRYPAELSGGQQQRVSLARMLAVEPEVLLLDEPLSNLDAQLRLDMRAELKRIHHTTRHTVVFVTHDQLEAMTMATHVAVMNKGELQQLAPPMDVYHRPANTFVARFVGSPPMNLLTPETRKADFLNDTRIRIAAARPDLEGRIASIGVRPEAVRLASPDEPPVDPARSWSFEANVDAVLPTGASWTVSLDTGGGEFYLTSPHEIRAARGSAVRCLVDVDDLHLFDADGRRLPDAPASDASDPADATRTAPEGAAP